MSKEIQKKDKKMEYKSFPISFKLKKETKGDDEKGIIEAYVSIFGNVDEMGEKILKGAFKKSLEKKLPKGVWMHNWDQPISKTLEAVEDDKGLKIKGKLILGVQKAKEAYELFKEDVIDEFSIGYKVVKDNIKNGVRELKEIELYEWSPVLVGANRETELLDVKGQKKTEEKKKQKSPTCRMEDESVEDCVKRKIPEILKEDPDMEQDQAVALASEMCKKKCEGKSAKIKKWEELNEQRKLIGLKPLSFERFKELPPIGEPQPAKKEGRVLSAKNRAIVKKAIDALQEVYNASELPKENPKKQKKILNTPDKKGEEAEPQPEKIIRIRQVAKQMDKSAEYLLRITKN